MWLTDKSFKVFIVFWVCDGYIHSFQKIQDVEKVWIHHFVIWMVREKRLWFTTLVSYMDNVHLIMSDITIFFHLWETFSEGCSKKALRKSIVNDTSIFMWASSHDSHLKRATLAKMKTVQSYCFLVSYMVFLLRLCWIKTTQIMFKKMIHSVLIGCTARQWHCDKLIFNKKFTLVLDFFFTLYNK